MAGQIQRKDTRAGLVPQKRDVNELTINPMRRFASCESAEQRQDAIVGALRRLAVLVNAEVDGVRNAAIAELLCNMQPRALALAFDYFEQNHTDESGRVIPALPAPAEIRFRGVELYRKECAALREGETVREMQELERRRREHPDEFVSFGDVMQALRDKFKTAPDPERTTPQQEAAADAAKARDVQNTKVQLHKEGKL